MTDRRTDRPTDRQTERYIESRARDENEIRKSEEKKNVLRHPWAAKIRGKKKSREKKKERFLPKDAGKKINHDLFSVLAKKRHCIQRFFGG